MLVRLGPGLRADLQVTPVEVHQRLAHEHHGRRGAGGGIPRSEGAHLPGVSLYQRRPEDAGNAARQLRGCRRVKVWRGGQRLHRVPLDLLEKYCISCIVGNCARYEYGC